MIPVAGAVTLLRADPLTQGPKIFAANCASCHRYNGTDGTGRKVTLIVKKGGDSPAGSAGDVAEAPATAADLGDFGTRDWIREVLTNFKAHFGAFRNSPDKKLAELLDKGDMADWSETNKKLLLDPANKQSLDALVEFIAAQSGRTDVSPIDQSLAQKGRAVFVEGKLAKEKLSTSCVDCHQLQPANEAKPLGESGSAPSLTGYAGTKWLDQFLADPGKPANYGEHNHMPAFKTRMSEREARLLARWLAGDYYRADGSP